MYSIHSYFGLALVTELKTCSTTTVSYNCLYAYINILHEVYSNIRARLKHCVVNTILLTDYGQRLSLQLMGPF